MATKSQKKRQKKKSTYVPDTTQQQRVNPVFYVIGILVVISFVISLIAPALFGY